MLLLSGVKAADAEGQLKRLRDGLRDVLNLDDSPINRYYAFENLINRFEQNCKRVAFERIIHGTYMISNQEAIKSEINEFYEEHVRHYPEQSKQAILDGQTPEPIVRNSAIAAHALCNQMLTLTMAKVEAARPTS